MTSIIISVILVILLGSAIIYIVREKKKGVRCVGCPHAGTCASRGKCPSQINAKGSDDSNTNS